MEDSKGKLASEGSNHGNLPGGLVPDCNLVCLVLEMLGSTLIMDPPTGYKVQEERVIEALFLWGEGKVKERWKLQPWNSGRQAMWASKDSGL